MAVQALYLCLVTPALDPTRESLQEIQETVDLEYMPESCAERIQLFLDQNPELPDAGHLPLYARQLLEGTASKLESIDKMLAEVSENWSVERMPLVDHAILLLAVYEMTEQPEIPVSVCINEAVELAKAFGGEDESARFVNGLLGRIARTYCADRLRESEVNLELEAETVED